MGSQFYYIFTYSESPDKMIPKSGIYIEIDDFYFSKNYETAENVVLS
jgi:hypothetical protein